MAPRCDSCKAEVFWALTSKGKRMPVDPHPTTRGNLRLHNQPRSVSVEVLTKGRLEDAREAGEQLYLSHYVSCPQGPAWRARKAKEAASG